MNSRSFVEKIRQNPDSASHNLRTDQSSSPEHISKLFPELQTDVRGLANPLEEEPVLVVLVDAPGRLPDRISAQLVISVTTWMRGEPMSRSVFTLVVLRFLDLIFFKGDFSQTQPFVHRAKFQLILERLLLIVQIETAFTVWSQINSNETFLD